MDDAASAGRIPAHVPPDRVRDINIYDFAVQDGEAQLGLREAVAAKAAPALFWSPHNGGHWIATTAEVIDQVINDAERFSNRYIGVPKELNPVRIFRPFQMDPPDHMAYRLLLSEAFSPRMVQTLKETARRTTVGLIEGFRARGECEFVSDFAQHMPIEIFMTIVGLPESDRLPLLAIAEKIARPSTDADRMAGYALLDDYVIKLIEARRDAPGEDFTAHLCRARIDGKPLDQDALIGIITLVLIAGLDTVAGMLGFFARFFARTPERRREIRENPALIPGAVEELLRRFAATTLAREARVDLELDGAAIRKGDMVSAPLYLHNLDPAKYADPLAVDFTRPRKPAHVSFGGAAHRCLGAVLARAELQIFLEEWLTRIPDYDIRPGAELKARTRVSAAITALPLVWTPA
jgi:cytochrome P450